MTDTEICGICGGTGVVPLCSLVPLCGTEGGSFTPEECGEGTCPKYVYEARCPSDNCGAWDLKHPQKPRVDIPAAPKRKRRARCAA